MKLLFLPVLLLNLLISATPARAAAPAPSRFTCTFRQEVQQLILTASPARLINGWEESDWNASFAGKNLGIIGDNGRSIDPDNNLGWMGGGDASAGDSHFSFELDYAGRQPQDGIKSVEVYESYFSGGPGYPKAWKCLPRIPGSE